MDKDYERGYAKGLKDGKESVDGVEEALARLNYLKKGGRWGADDADSDPYASGFEDCLRTLGVLK